MYGIILLVFLLFIIILSYQITRDFFSPLCFFSLLQILRYVPYLCGKDYEALTFQTLNLSNTFPTFVFEMTAVSSVVFGYLFANAIWKRKKGMLHSPIKAGIYSKKSIMILFVLGMIGRVAIIKYAGGISTILNDNAVAYSKLDSGTGYLYLLSDCVIVSCMMQLSNVVAFGNAGRKKERNKNLILLLIMAALYIFTFLVFTSRSPILELVLYMVFGINYLYRKFRIKDFLNPKMLVVVLFAVVIIVVLPIIRVSNYDDSQNGGSLIWHFFDQFTIVGRDTFVYNTFGKSQNFWLGKSYLGLFTSFIPSSIFASKPPVDDGIYLSNLIYGYQVNPPVSDTVLNVKYSIPFSTSGLSYANFGVVGLIAANFLLGIAFSFGYRLVKNKATPFIVLIYVLLVYQFELTTLSIVQTIMPVLICLVSYFVFGRGKSVKTIIQKRNVNFVN